MNQSEVARLVTKLMINTGTKPRRIKSNLGYRGQLDILRKNVTALIVNERIEFPENRGIVTRQYTEKLISDAILNGDQHKHTMEMASWWLENDKSAVYKLFKVLVPRFQDFNKSYSRLFFPPTKLTTLEGYNLPLNARPKSNMIIVELKGNPFPPLAYSNTRPNKKHIHNVLLAEARRDLDRLK